MVIGLTVLTQSTSSGYIASTPQGKIPNIIINYCSQYNTHEFLSSFFRQRVSYCRRIDWPHVNRAVEREDIHQLNNVDSFFSVLEALRSREYQVHFCRDTFDIDISWVLYRPEFSRSHYAQRAQRVPQWTFGTCCYRHSIGTPLWGKRLAYQQSKDRSSTGHSTGGLESEKVPFVGRS